MAMFVAPDPQAGSALVAAAQWIEGVLLGSVGTTVAVIAVASMGFAMLNGQASPRQAARVVLGIFILFGAPVIVRELTGTTRGGGEPPAENYGRQVTMPPAPPTPPPFDPYAGASVPNAQN